MIVLSAGLPKSGTAWYFNLTNELLIAAGCADARVVRKKYRLQDILNEQNCLLVKTDFLSLAQIMLPHFMGHTYAIKTHDKPQLWLKASKWVFRSTYIYRDPRDVALSAFENGKKNAGAGCAAYLCKA